MSENCSNALDEIKRQLIGDYYTPTYRFEVAFDTLLTPYITGIVNRGLTKNKQLVAKEMCLPRENANDAGKWTYGKNGAHIDYLLADDEFVYMTELKTTDSSIKDEQIEYYCKFLSKEETFGEVLGKNLATHVYGKYPTKIKNYEPKNFKGQDFVKFLDDVFEYIFEDLQNLNSKNDYIYNQNYTNLAKAYLKEHNLEKTYKYLYTAAQVYEYLSDGNELWNNKLKLIYITPTLKKDKQIIEI